MPAGEIAPRWGHAYLRLSTDTTDLLISTPQLSSQSPDAVRFLFAVSLDSFFHSVKSGKQMA